MSGIVMCAELVKVFPDFVQYQDVFLVWGKERKEVLKSMSSLLVHHDFWKLIYQDL